MQDRTVTINLVEPFEGHDGMVTQVVIRRPGYAEHSVLGDPVVVARNPDGTLFPVERDQIIKSYIERCVERPNASLLNRAGLADSIRIREAMLDFFSKARDRIQPEPQSS